MNLHTLTNFVVQENIPLNDYCTLGIGGPARFFLEIRSVKAMHEALLWCKQQQIEYFILGKGSNCLFDDRGFNGAVILNKIEFMNEITPGTFHVGSGYSFALLGVQTARRGWGGLEFASGIPASVGGAVYMNAGANGSETSQTLISVDFIDENGVFKTIPKRDLAFSYRHSPFQSQQGVISGATFSLFNNPEARQSQIQIVNKRKQSQPYGSMSAGCIFLNPPNENAGQLIDQCGLKGTFIGGAEVSHVHANFLVNKGTATCRDMQELIAMVKEKVKAAKGIELSSEVRYIPFKEFTYG